MLSGKLDERNARTSTSAADATSLSGKLGGRNARSPAKLTDGTPALSRKLGGRNDIRIRLESEPG